ncbi:helix-turn-helix domain-containing protein [Cytobacillus sp. FSL K6-0265]|uniref:helix-turn-helix domain-containing protein n=1 Tax=Cytobacillus sp. FSL K6-0265 TaxID=2921448 RepID=UPI0030F861FE
MNYGQNFKNIRISKGYSLKEVAEGIISSSFLSKFERGESDISLSNFILLLNKLNISIEEYILISRDYQPSEFEIFLHKIRHAYEQNNIPFLISIYKEEEKKWKSHLSSSYKCNYIMTKALILDLNRNFEITDSERNFISDYLLKNDHWGYYEIILFGNTMSILKYQTVIILAKEIISKSKLNIQIPKIKTEFIRILLNVVIYTIETGHLNDAKWFLSYIDEIPNNTHFYFEKTKHLFLKGIYQIEKNQLNKGIKNAEKAIEIIGILENANIQNNHKLFLKKFI